MTRTVAILSALAAGGLVALQPPANAALAHHVGGLGAAFVSTLISIVTIFVLLLVVGDPGRLSGIVHFRPEWVIGGLGGAAVVLVSLAAVRPLGATAVIALLVASQLFVAVLADRFGWLGLHHVGLGGARVGGVLLVVAGSVLVTRG